MGLCRHFRGLIRPVRRGTGSGRGGVRGFRRRGWWGTTERDGGVNGGRQNGVKIFAEMREKALRRKVPDGCFRNVSKDRSENMRSIKGSGNITTERWLRLALVRAGLRGWKVRPGGLPGNPDFVFPKRKVAIFTDGCFWHGCPHCYHAPVRNNSSYWREKIKRNRVRDRKTRRQLQTMGWQIVRIWEHELKISTGLTVRRIGGLLLRKGT